MEKMLDDLRWRGVRCWLTVHLDAADPVSVEERIYLFKTMDELSAIEAARIAANNSYEYQNADGELVQSRLVGSPEVFDTFADEVENGMEVYAQVYELNDDGSIASEWEEVRDGVPRGHRQ